LQSDNNKFSRRADRNRKMATEGHGCGGKKNHQQQRKDEMDKELTEVRARMEELALRVQQNAKTHWVYEWPLRRKAKWPVKKLLARRQQRLLRRWLRYVKSLRATEEMVHACEPEAGRNLSDDEEERSSRDLIDCQVGRDGLSNCQVGNRKRSSEGLVYCQEGGAESSNCQEGTEMGSTDLIDCQVGRGRGETPYCQVGKGEQMRPCESLMNSEVSSYQQEEMIEKEDQKSILMIGGIRYSYQ
jgi:hypothetical protein